MLYWTVLSHRIWGYHFSSLCGWSEILNCDHSMNTNHMFFSVALPFMLYKAHCTTVLDQILKWVDHLNERCLEIPSLNALLPIEFGILVNFWSSTGTLRRQNCFNILKTTEIVLILLIPANSKISSKAHYLTDLTLWKFASVKGAITYNKSWPLWGAPISYPCSFQAVH